MAEWKPIEELFDFEKGTLQSSKCTAGKYIFITAADEWKTHENFTHDCEALVFAMGASGSLGRTHYVKGKFISSDLCFILTPKKGLKLDMSFYHRLFNFLRQDVVKKTATGTSKLAINRTNFGAYRMPYFDYDHQLSFRDKMKSIANNTNDFLNEIDYQFAVLKQFRQSILQEAIEGKLTTEWRKQNHDLISGDNHASKLFEKIKVEKEQLIASHLIKKETTQEPAYSFPITTPEEWISCRIIDISKQVTDGTHVTPTYVKEGNIFLSAQNVKPFRFIPANHQFITKAAFDYYRKNRVPEKGDLLIARVGAGIGETAVIDHDVEFAFYVSLGLIKIFKQYLNPHYLAIVFNSPYGVAYSKGNISSGGTSAGNYNLGRIRAFEIPLPSFAEQQAIVDRVNKIMAMIDELETQVSERKDHSEMLMQSVLREAFAG